MKKILVGYISEGKADGINSYIRNFVRAVKEEGMQVDFLTRSEGLELSDVGFDEGNLYSVSRNRHPFKQLAEMKKLIQENQYDVAYFNVSEAYNCVGILAARLFGVKKIVVHSHSSGVENASTIKTAICKVANSICKCILVSCTDMQLACSKKAAEWLYTDNIVDDRDYELIYNTVDYQKYKFDSQKRAVVREELHLQDKFVIGHVGRFSYPKNHKYLMDIFKKVLEKKADAVLVCAGAGPDFEEICRYAEEIGVKDQVKFLGEIDNVHELLQAFDVFVLPSRFEGLPIVAVEAQFAGVPCLLSANVDNGVVIAKNTQLINVGENDVEHWAKAIVGCEKRENELLEKADCYKFEKQKKQFLNIVDDKAESNGSTLLPDLATKVLLTIHYLLNITCLFNGFSWLLPVAFIPMLVTFVLHIKKVWTISKDILIRTLMLFMVSYGVTFLLSTNYNIISSIKIAIWLVIQFAFAFGYNHFKSRKQIIFEIDTVARIFVVACSVSNIYNLFLLFGNVTKIVTSYGGQPLLFGIAPWGRFFGNHYDPNYASICYGCAIIMAVYLLEKSRRTSTRIMYAVTILLQSIYIIFAQSRTSKVALLIGLLVYAFFVTARKNKKFFSVRALRNVVLVLCVVMIVPNSTIDLYNGVKEFNATHHAPNQDSSEDDSEEDSEDEYITIGREDVNSSDVSNRRFDIWKSGIEISSSNMVYGIGFANIKPYALDEFPNTYIVNNDYIQFEAFHNMFMDILVSQGLIGMGIVVYIIVYFAVLIFSQMNKTFIADENGDTAIMLLSCILIVLASAMFLSVIFYVNNICTYLFWLLLGYLYFFLKKKRTA